MKIYRLALALCFFCAANTLHAGSATWKAHPPGNDWNNAADWRPRTIPNGAGDTATFAASDTVDVSLTAPTEVDGLVFTPGASAFTITADLGVLTFSGVGITNNSGATQNFVANQPFADGFLFYNQATAGSRTAFTVENLAAIFFNDRATAGSGTFIIKGNPGFMDGASVLVFDDHASAADGIFFNGGGTGFDAEGGGTVFLGQSTAANGTFTNMPGTDAPTYGSALASRRAPPQAIVLL